MGYDYYILKVLHIYCNDQDLFQIELERQGCNYRLPYKKADHHDNYGDVLAAYKKQAPMSPMTIYTNHRFSNLNLETKYRTLIEYALHQYDKSWRDITCVMKVEERLET